MNHPGLALHVLALGLALALAGTDAALHPPDPPRPTLAPRCSYQRLRLVGAPLPASHPRYGREVERREGWLDTPPGGQGPIPVTCWLREGRLIELTTRGSEAIRDSEAAAALGSERGALGELSPGAAIDLDWIWAELGLAHSLGGEVELALVACDFAPGFLSYDQVSSPPGRCAVVHALRDPEPERSAEPGVLLRLGVGGPVVGVEGVLVEGI